MHFVLVKTLLILSYLIQTILNISNNETIVWFTGSDEEPSAHKGRKLNTPTKTLLEPASKRLRSTTTKQKLSGRFCQERNDSFQSALKENFVESPGKQASQESVLSVLNLDESDRGLATRAVNKAFPSATVNRRKGTYSNVRKAVSFGTNAEKSDTPTLDAESEIANIQGLISVARGKGNELLDDIIARVTAGESNALQALLLAYKRETELLTSYSELLDKLYEREIQFLMNDSSSLPQSEKTKLTEEVEMLSQTVSFGVRSGEKLFDINDKIFEELVKNVSENCPFLYDIVKTLFPTDNTRKEKGAIHSLSLLMSLRNNHCQNDITLVFTLMLVAYGAGTRMVNMLNRIGLTMHWDTLMSFLDKYNKEKFDELHSNMPHEKPLILLLDNVNIYRGNQRHHRLFKSSTPNMWNFTVRGLLNPDITGVEDLFSQPETSLQSQDNVVEWNAENVQLDNCEEHSLLWKRYSKRYILSLLYDGLNRIPSHDKPLNDMSERECNQWLSKADYSIQQQNVKISIPTIESIATSSSTVKTDVHILPLSLENNATLTGTSAILDQFAKEFNLSNKLGNLETLPFDNRCKNFSLKQARQHVEFLIMLYQHRDEMADLIKNLEAAGKVFDKELSTNDEGTDDELIAMESDSDDENGTTIQQAKSRFAKCDKACTELYNNIADKLWQSKQNDSVERVIQDLRSLNLDVRDHLGRTLLHLAVEQGNYDLACCLLQVGCNPNAKEMCGATPLVIAVIKKNIQVCKLLVDHRGSVRGPLFTNIPCPLKIAEQMQLAEIYEILNPQTSDSEDDDISAYDDSFKRGARASGGSAEPVTPVGRQSQGFVTGLVGDQGTCKTIRGVMGRASAYDWAGIIPGDLHTKGYLCEACFKEQGPGGFHYITNKVMKRPKLITDVFKKKKFEAGNQVRIKEAVKDCARSYGVAAVIEFANSDFFPGPRDMGANLRKTGNHNDVLYDAFVRWLEQSCERSVAFSYYSRMFLYYGPLLELFEISTSHVLGQEREACFILQLPTYAHLNFKNYFTETFAHVVNFLGKWPLAFRKLLQKNCGVNLSGNKGSAIELDAFVEAEIVQPLKTYVSGKRNRNFCCCQ